MEAIRVTRIGVALVIAVLIGIGILSALAMDARGDELVQSYLDVEVDQPQVETYDRIQITVRSQLLVQDELGNFSLVVNPNSVNLTLYAMDLENLIVYQERRQLISGQAVFYVYVLPEWTSSNVRIRVEDRTAGLVNDRTTFRTDFSMEYVLYLMQTERYQDDLRDEARFQARLDLFTYMDLYGVGSLALALFVVFLRADHRRSRRIRAPSIWDRFVHRVWPYAWVPDEAYVFLDESRTWAPGVVKLERDFKREAAIRKLKAQIAEIKDEYRFLNGGG